MTVKTQKTVLAFEKSRLAAVTCMNSQSTKEMLDDPQEKEALLESTARIRRLAKERRNAKEIPLVLRLMPCNP